MGDDSEYPKAWLIDEPDTTVSAAFLKVGRCQVDRHSVA